ncbi:hypothetical protein D3C78_691020 [compost metagenome]
MGAEQQSRRRVARVLHGDQAARTDQHPRNQVQCLLRAVAHHHILILAIDPARECDVPRNGVAQGGQALRLAVQALGAGNLAQRVGGAASPVILGKLALAGGATNEVVAQRAFQGRMTQEYRQVAPGFDHLKAAKLRVVLFTLHFRRARIDVSAFADHPGEEVFVGQLGVGIGNGLA